MSQQEHFDSQIARVVELLDGLGEAHAREAQEIREFIANNPAVNTSALEDVIGRLEGLNTSAGDIFTPPANEPVVDEGNAEGEAGESGNAAEPTPDPKDEGQGGGATTGEPQPEPMETSGEDEGERSADGESESSAASGPIEG